MIKDEIIVAYEDALSKEDYDKIREIVSYLNNLSGDLKKSYLELYEKINNDLFQLDRSISNYEYEKYVASIKSWENETLKISEKEIKTKTKSEYTYLFDRYLVNLYNRNKDIFSKLQDYELFKFEYNDLTDNPRIVILCDRESFQNPLIDMIQEREREQRIAKKLIEEFVKEEPLSPDDSNKSYICILCLTPKLENFDLAKNLKDIFHLFDTVTHISISTNDLDINIDNLHFEKCDDNKVDEIFCNANKVFNNRKLQSYEQKIIKKFFGKHPGIIDYKILKPGASGSSVYEVQFNPIHMLGSKRFVTKISKKEIGKQRKLKKEKENFDEYVKNVSTSTPYDADYKEIESHEAIQYNYASMDSTIDSSSFYELIEDFINKGKTTLWDLETILSCLLTCDLFIQGWKKKQKTKASCGEIYKVYLKNEDQILKVLKEIILENAEIESLVLNYNKIKSCVIDTCLKVCHGDLHSENFFWDNNKVYLIDFGFTDFHPALIDHAFLEASIRFKHFPRYVPCLEYLEYDKHFLSNLSFGQSFDLSFVQRPLLRDLYTLINQIRVDSSQYFYNSESPMEYMISLFIITFKMIQYNDLNQLYAFKEAHLLSREISKYIP